MVATLSGYILAFYEQLFRQSALLCPSFLFTYFYTAVTFDPKMISQNLQKAERSFPGIRPKPADIGPPGQNYNQNHFGGRAFPWPYLPSKLPLGTIKALTGISSLAIGGTALLIVVSVVLETSKQIEAQVVMKEYE